MNLPMKATTSNYRCGFSSIILVAVAVFVFASLAGGYLFLAQKAGPEVASTLTPTVTEAPVTSPTAAPTVTPAVGQGTDNARLDKDLQNVDNQLSAASDAALSAEAGLNDKMGDLAE